MSILYCTIPHFAAALARRDRPELGGEPLILVGPENRVFGVSRQAAACHVTVGMPARAAQIRCPECRLIEADLARCRETFEELLQLLEQVSSRVEPHGWGAAYVGLGDVARERNAAIALCRERGRAIRRELGEQLQPALGWNSTKFTAQVAAHRTRPGNLMAISASQERRFLRPLPTGLLPLEKDALRRLWFLGLRTLGQYAALPRAAVWQQFGRPGVLAHRFARGEDDRPVIPRGQAPRLAARRCLDHPLAQRAPLLALLQRMIEPLLSDLRDTLQACGELRLTARFDDGSAQEKTRTWLNPTADRTRVSRAIEDLLDRMHWTVPAIELEVALDQIQDLVFEQLSLFETQDKREHKIRQVHGYLTARFGVSHLRRASLSYPLAPLPEWRVVWQSEGKP